MSLVAYASSAESDSDSQSPASPPEPGDSEPPASPPEPVQPQRPGGLFSSLPPPRNSKAQLGVPTESGFFPAPGRTAPPGLPEDLHADSWLGLPPPRRSGLNLPAPSGDTSAPGAKKRTEPVRISAPQLQRDDSDSDEDEPAKKKKANRGAAEGTGLSALLPQPKNLVGKESKRQLLPYAFTKKVTTESSQDEKKSTKPAASLKAKSVSRSDVHTTLSPSLIKAAAKSASLQITKQITQEEEDSDEEVKHGNFFSLSDDNPPMIQTETLTYKANIAAEATITVTDPVKLPDETADAPLEFKSPESPGTPPPPGTTSWEPRNDFHSHAFDQYTEYGGSSTVPSLPPPPTVADPLYQEYYSAGYYEESDPPSSSPTESGSEQSSFIDEEAFKRLQGKRNRGREEINFLEIKGDDQLSSNQQWMTKSLTEEKNMKSFSKKKGDQPTGQQRRKHQITYLIHQAKERELELKNAWSDNKLSRRQTQAKYGF